MKSAGIICECNPFHSGHKHLITQAKAAGADAVVCVMSGYFTQRGEVALADPYTRAKALIAGGADLVLELPYPYSAAGAEFFADAGVEILSRLGVSELWFGSECGDIERLSRAAQAVLSDEFASRYAKSTTDSVGTARAYFEALQHLCGDGAPFASNDTLGISYLCALIKKKSTMRPVTIQREGSAYLDGELRKGEHPSATALRRLLLADGVDAALPDLLPETAEALMQAEKEGFFPADLHFAELAILSALRFYDASKIGGIAELGGGLGNRLIDAANRATTLDELLSLASTKKYPLSRLRRGILFALTKVRKEYLTAPPAYVRMLAANPVGCTFLAENRRRCDLAIVTRQADVPNDDAAQAQEALHRNALSLFTLCLKKPLVAHDLLRKNPSILK